MNHEVEPVVVKDRNGKEHQFVLTASALRRAMRRLRQIAKEDSDETAGGIEAAFAFAWESRVDKSAKDEEEYFEQFTAAQLTSLVQNLQKEHQPEANPTTPEPAN